MRVMCHFLQKIICENWLKKPMKAMNAIESLGRVAAVSDGHRFIVAAVPGPPARNPSQQ